MAQGRDKKGNLRETPIQKTILDNLTCRGIFCWRSQPTPVPIRQGRRIVGVRKVDKNLKGMPDIMAVIKGRLFAIEVKKVGGTQSTDQKRWEAKLREAGAVYILTRSWMETAQILLQYGVVLDI